MSNQDIPRIVVAGLRGGSGKTIVSLSLITVLKQRGHTVSSFKKGPDYIDAGWLAKASGSPCYNLDLFMLSPDQVLKSFISNTNPPFPPFTKGGRGGIIALIEGNRGLYDGIDAQGSYSTAELAKLLQAPVIIAVDCTKTTSTIAAMILGCQKMDPDVIIGGVVLNRIATARQEEVIRKAIDKNCAVPVLGAIPRFRDDPFPERHMGLIPFQESTGIEKSLTAVRDIGEKYLDYDAVIQVAGRGGPVPDTGYRVTDMADLEQGTRVRIGIIRDSAFQFYYPDNCEELERRGAELVDVSPLRDEKLPPIDALYIGGGFPETHAIDLAKNSAFKESLHKAVEDGLPVYAECGGLMYLGSTIRLGGKTYPMTGILPITFSLEQRPQAHGYTVVQVREANPFFPMSTELRGHEFHYSKVLAVGNVGVSMAFDMKRGKGIQDKKDGICYKNVLAAFTHLHALGSPEWAEGMINTAREYRDQRSK